MKKLLILPGNSSKNQKWGEAMAEFFQDQFDEIYLQLYDHWESGEEVIDVPTELDKIIATVEGSENDDWYICSKSVGTLVSLLAVQERIVSPQRCLFFGMPLDLAAEELFNDNWSALEGFAASSLAFHNQDDPVTDSKFTEEKIQELSASIEFISVPGDTHEYLDFDRYGDQIKAFFFA